MMTVLRFLLKPISLLMACIILFIGCTKQDMSEVYSKADYSGEDIYKSVFFGTGKFGENITLLKSNSDFFNQLSVEQKEKVEEQTNKMMLEISKKEPSFFKKFKRDLLSGNHIKINNAIHSGGIALKQSISILHPQITNELNAIQQDINHKNLKLKSKEDLIEYVKKLQVEDKLTTSSEVLNKNMIAEENVQAASLAWAVAAALYFAVAAHNTIAVTAMIYYKGAFWGPSIDTASIEKPETMVETTEDLALKSELLIEEIAKYGSNN